MTHFKEKDCPLSNNEKKISSSSSNRSNDFLHLEGKLDEKRQSISVNEKKILHFHPTESFEGKISSEEEASLSSKDQKEIISVKSFSTATTTSKASERANEKVSHFLRLKQQGIHFNENLMQSKAFKNPNLYANIVENLGINDSGSNDPNAWNFNPPLNAFYDERYREQLEKNQQSKRNKSS